ncbi:MAG: aldo/keto reductase [Chloroflexota bacterium]|nr:aldo/keto reductase [Chloroflexota bacterium]MXX66121.1 aldo/keto reductase [Chloroflexota bacterium]
MEKRRLGRTGHESTLITVGTAGFGRVSQAEVDTAMEHFIDHEVNHVDIAPTYGQAMERFRDWLPKMRDQIFLGCKTQGRSRTEAWADIHSTFERLGTDQFDLFQLHAVTTMAELDAALAPHGAIRALEEMREQGQTRWIGITSHGPYAPRVFLNALERYDFDTVMFPVAKALWRSPEYREDTERLLNLCHERDVGIQCIKILASGGWGSAEKDCHTWYDPVREQEEIHDCVNWLFSQDVHTAPSTGEVTIVPKLLDAAERFHPISSREQSAIVGSHRPRFPEPRLAILPA